jgi:prepilin-type N-terminal cleavage/methylation domain-containing protein
VKNKFQIANGFTLIEVMVVVVLLSLIVVALMSVFSSTQTAFRASVTQTDILEGGRAAMDMIAQDLKEMAPSLGTSNGAVNFNVVVNSSALVQPLIASNQSRTNVLEKIFILSRDNQTWTGVGYVVETNSASSINPLYRFSTNMNVGAGSPWSFFNSFTNAVSNNNFTGMSHLLDGVVDLRVRAFDTNGVWMNGSTNENNVYFLPLNSGSDYGETGFFMFSNTLPASVEIEMATIEDRTLQRASIWPNNSTAQISYLEQQAGKVHVFRQRVSIPNVDPSAYQ